MLVVVFNKVKKEIHPTGASVVLKEVLKCQETLARWKSLAPTLEMQTFGPTL